MLRSLQCRQGGSPRVPVCLHVLEHWKDARESAASCFSCLGKGRRLFSHLFVSV